MREDAHAAALLALALFGALGVAAARPGLGLALLAAGLCALAAARAGRRDAWSVALWLSAAGLVATPALRDAAWVWVPALAAAGALASLAAAGGRSGRAVLAGLVAVVRRLPLGPFGALAPLGRAAGRLPGAHVLPALRGGLLAAVLLAVFVPLLASADAAFAQVLDRAVPDDVSLDAGWIVGRTTVLLAVLATGGALALAAACGPARAARPPRARLGRIEWALPLAALAILFAAFLALQLTTLFAGHDHVLRTTGLTYAEYAREGFGQLILAAGLTLGVIAAARRWARADGGDERLLRALLIALCVLCLVLLASALRRLGLYEDALGFTRLRLLAHSAILWLGAVLALAIASLAVRRGGWLPRAVVAVSAAGALAFVGVNPDGWIAGRNVERFQATGELDASYLAGLSADASGSLERIVPLAWCAGFRWQVAEPDGLLGANLGRARGREAAGRISYKPACG